MKNRHILYIAFIIEALLMLGIILLISLRIKDGLYVDRSYNDPIEITFTVLKISSVVLYFIFGLYFYIRNNKNKIIAKNGLIIIYFLIIIIADIFFSILRISLGGIITFLIAYSLIMILLYKHYIEIIIRVVLFAIGTILLFILNKFTFQSFITITLAEVLIVNMVISWIKYSKDKNISNLFLSLAVTLAFISDTFIGIRSTIKDPKVINDISSFIIWPTYMMANFMLLCFIHNKKNINSN